MSVYMIRMKSGMNAVKIGRSCFSKDRLRSLQCATPAELEIVDVIHDNDKIEKELHRLCKEYRIRGEWFYDCVQVRAIWKRVKEEHISRRAPAEPSDGPNVERMKKRMM